MADARKYRKSIDQSVPPGRIIHQMMPDGEEDSYAAVRAYAFPCGKTHIVNNALTLSCPTDLQHSTEEPYN